MNTIIEFSKIKFVILVFIGLIVFVCGCTYKNNVTYQSIKVSVKKQAVIEYGSAKYDIEDIVDVDGEIVSIKQDLDTKIIGPQEVVVEVKKNNVVREIPILIEVVDTTAPIINLNNDTIEVEYGTKYNLNDNIKEVIDEIDGKINYQDLTVINNELEDAYYTITSESDVNLVGEHIITVKAVDKYGNVNSVNFNYKVIEPVYVEKVYNNLPANINGNNIVSLAYSLIGSRYVSGGNSLSGFDCSGFVQYLYSQYGVSISRSASTQIYDGVAVNYENAQPGDILSWGYDNGVVTHSALYVGDGMMIHAANPSQGVILSNVAAWERGSNITILSVRRV